MTGPSNIVTCHLWRHIDLYDPRALLKVRDLASLKEQIKWVDKMNGELYFVVGMVGFAEATSGELMATLRDEKQFEKVAHLWAQESIHTLEVYRYRGWAGAESP
jgi:hypothetical protein